MNDTRRARWIQTADTVGISLLATGNALKHRADEDGPALRHVGWPAYGSQRAGIGSGTSGASVFIESIQAIYGR